MAEMPKLIWTHTAPEPILSRIMRDTAVGFVLLPRTTDEAACARRLFASSLAAHGLILEEWREAGHYHFDAIITPRGNMEFPEFARRLGEAKLETELRAKAYALTDFRILSAEPVQSRELSTRH